MTVTETVAVCDRVPLVPVTVIVYVPAGVPEFPPPPLLDPPPHPMSAAANSAAASSPSANFNRRFFVEITRRSSRPRRKVAPPVTNQLGPGRGPTAEGAVVVTVSVVDPLAAAEVGLSEQPGPSDTTGATTQLNETVPENALRGETAIVEAPDWPGETVKLAGFGAERLKSAAEDTVTVVAAEVEVA